MDFMKVFDQTVRDIKREVNLKVLKIPEIEQKVLDATDDEPWGPHGTVLTEIAQATKKYSECQLILNVLWTRLEETGKNWRLVYKALTVIEFLVGHGSERVVDDIIEHTFQIASLTSFEFVEPSGKDVGLNVRKKAETIAALLNDKEKIQVVRSKAAANRDKYVGLSSAGISFRSSATSYGSSSYGSYDDGEKDSNRGNNDYYVKKNVDKNEETKNSSRFGRKSETVNVPSASVANTEDEFDDFDPRGILSKAAPKPSDNGQSLLVDLMDATTSTDADVASSKAEVDLFADAAFVSAQAPPVSFTHTQPVDLFGDQNSAVDLFSSKMSPAQSSSVDLFSSKMSPAQSSSVDFFSSKMSPAQSSSVDLFSSKMFPAQSSSVDLFSSKMSPAQSSSAVLFSSKMSPAQSSSVDLFSSNVPAAENSSNDFFSSKKSSAYSSSVDYYSSNTSPAQNVSNNLFSSKISPVDLFSSKIPRAENCPNSPVDLFSSETVPAQISPADLFSSETAPAQISPADLFSSSTTPAQNCTVDMFSTNISPQEMLPNDPSASLQRISEDSDIFGGFNSATWSEETNVKPSLSKQTKEKFEVKSGIWADSLSRGLIDLNISAPKKVSLVDVGVVGDLDDAFSGKAMGAHIATFTSSAPMHTHPIIHHDFFSSPGPSSQYFGHLHK